MSLLIAADDQSQVALVELCSLLLEKGCLLMSHGLVFELCLYTSGIKRILSHIPLSYGC